MVSSSISEVFSRFSRKDESDTLSQVFRFSKGYHSSWSPSKSIFGEPTFLIDTTASAWSEYTLCGSTKSDQFQRNNYHSLSRIR